MGVSFGAAGEFLKRQQALAAERAAQRVEDEPTKPSLTVVGEGVVVRDGTPPD